MRVAEKGSTASIMHQLIGVGTPRGLEDRLQGRLGALTGLVTALAALLADRWADLVDCYKHLLSPFRARSRFLL